MAQTKTELGSFREKVKKASLPFAPEDHEWKPLSITEKGAWIAFYVDMRKMMERLQDIFGETASVNLSVINGVNGYNVLASLIINEENGNTVVYQDFGYAPPDTAEGLKSAATDAYRRVLSHVGIGRYLYHLPKIFIGGSRNGYRFVPKRNPIEVLAEVLQNGYDGKVLFVDAEEDEAYTGRNAGTVKSGHTESENGNRRNKRSDEWLKVLGVDNTEGAISVLKEISKRHGVYYTDKQYNAFLRMVDPSETSLEDLETDPTKIKVLLDGAFSKLKR